MTLPSVLFSSLADVGIVAALTLVMTLVVNSSLTVAALAALLVIAVCFAEPVSLFAGITAVFEYVEAGFRRIKKLLSIAPLAVQEPIRQPETFHVRFDNVGFA